MDRSAAPEEGRGARAAATKSATLPGPEVAVAWVMSGDGSPHWSAPMPSAFGLPLPGARAPRKAATDGPQRVEKASGKNGAASPLKPNHRMALPPRPLLEVKNPHVRVEGLNAVA